MGSELGSLQGWVRPYTKLKHAVVVLAQHLRAPLKHAIINSGPAVPLPVHLSEPTGEGAQCTRRIIVEPDESVPGDQSVRVRLVDLDDGSAAAERTIAWNGDSVHETDQVITAIRELAGLDAA